MSTDVKEQENSITNDINWNELEKETKYSKEERQQLIDKYDETLNLIQKNEIVKGTIVGITDKDVVLNVGFKSDGMVPLSEFRNDADLKIGKEVEVFVVNEEDRKGQLVLSRKNANLIRAWEKIVSAYTNDEVIEGQVLCKTKGGLVADVFGFETFLPGSQIDVKPIIDYDYYVGKTMEFKVVKINEAIKNAVVSHKALIESELETQRQDIIAKLEKGQVLEGTVKNLTDFGAFIDLGGVDGLLYLSDISWGRISHPSEVLELNQKLNVVVLDFDDAKKRISLGLKQLEPHPWDVLDQKFEEGLKVKGKVVNIEDYGAFLEIVPGVEGLVHISEISWGLHPVNPKEFFKLGDVHEAIIVTINREDRKMSLSIRQLKEDPWNNIENDFPEGSKHPGKVISITPYGAFLELAEGIGGLVHVSDFSWTKKVSHPSEFVKVGDELEVVVLKIDGENRRLSLGHKQVEEDPWDTFKKVFPPDSEHQGTVVRVDERDAVILMPYGLEAICSVKNLKKEDGSVAKVEETLPFKVNEFESDKRKIFVAHTRTWKDKQEPESAEQEGKKKSSKKKSAKAPKNYAEKSTLGDLEVFSQLKEQFEDTGSAKGSSKKEAEPEAEKKAKAPKAEIKTEAEPKEEAAEKKKEEKAAEKAKAESEIKEEKKEEEPQAKAKEEEKKEEPEAKAKEEEKKEKPQAKAKKEEEKKEDDKASEEEKK